MHPQSRRFLSLLTFNCVVLITISSVLPPNASAENPITFSFSGVISKTLDLNRSTDEGNTIIFPPIPVGSTFSGNFTFESTAPQTGGDEDIALYYDLGPSSRMAAVINGLTFLTQSAAPRNPYIQVVAPDPLYDGFSRLVIGTQPISLPSGWSVPNPIPNPYLSLSYFYWPIADPFSLPTDTRGIDLTKSSGFWLDFLQDRVVVNGVTYSGRIAAFGTITAIIPEPGTFIYVTTLFPALLLLKRRRA